MARPVDQYQPPPGQMVAKREPHIFEIAAGAVNENERQRGIRRFAGPTDIDHMLAQTVDFDETPARRMRALDQCGADKRDNGANDKDDCNTRQHDTAKPLPDRPGEKDSARCGSDNYAPCLCQSNTPNRSRWKKNWYDKDRKPIATGHISR